MSNIPDITSLSDLLATSPNQPASDRQNEPTIGASSLRLDLATRGTISTSGVETTHEETGSTEEGDAGESQYQESTSVPTETPEITSSSGIRQSLDQSEMETLLHQQSIKLSLVAERNDLLKKRAELKNAVDNLHIKVKYYNDIRHRNLTKQKLEKLLEENNLDTRQQEPETITNPSISNDYDDDLILKNLNVLPSNNWEDRLRLIKKFYPFLDLGAIQTYNFYDQKDKLLRAIEYKLVSPLLFRLPFKLVIDTRDESIIEIQLPSKTNNNGPVQPWKKQKVSPYLTTITILSPSFAHTLVRNYLPNKKINLIMFGLSSLSSVLHKRISMFYKLIRRFNRYVLDRERLDQILQKEELSDNVKLFAILKSLDTLRLTAKKNDKSFTVCFIWEIILEDKVTAECESRLKLSVYDADGKQAFLNVNQLFSSLVKKYGIVHSLETVLKTTFDIEIKEII